MAINYVDSNIPVGNTVFGVGSGATLQVWGAAFYDERFMLVLVMGSDNVLEWKKVDTMSTTIAAYSLAYSPSALSVATTDHTANGQFLGIDNGFIYYLKSDRLYKATLLTGALINTGYQVLRDSVGSALTAANLKAVAIKGNEIYLAGTNGTSVTLYRYTQTSWTWNGTNQTAVTQTVVTGIASGDAPVGLFPQAGASDVVLLTKGVSTQAIKYNSTLATRIGATTWVTPSAFVFAAQFKGTILFTAACDSSQAGVGMYLFRSGDGSTGVVAVEQTTVSVSPDRVKAGSGAVVTIKYIAKDGYGVIFAPTENVRFTAVRVGDVVDKNDAALSTASTGPFRTNAGTPLQTQLDVPFNAQGEATVYAEAPVEIPVETLLYRIKIKYPIFS